MRSQLRTLQLNLQKWINEYEVIFTKLKARDAAYTKWQETQKKAD